MGEDSKLAKSFDRIRSILRKKKYMFTGKSNNENEKNTKLEQIVNEVIIQKREKDEKRFSAISENRFSGSLQETIIGFPHDNVYNHSYQEALNRYQNSSEKIIFFDYINLSLEIIDFADLYLVQIFVFREADSFKVQLIIMEVKKH